MKYFSLIFIIFIVACTSAESTISKTGIDVIEFGSGGGITGQEETYSLFADGKLSKKEKEIRKVDQKEVLQLFEKAADLKEVNHQEPGNIYSFITIKSSENTHRIVWRPEKKPNSEEVIILYNELKALIP